MEKASLGRLLLGVAYLEGDFVLRSGRRSRYYLDKYLFETEPRVLRGIVFELAVMMRNELARGAVYQRLAAPELGAVALGAGLSLELGIPFLIVRKASKDYGTAKAIEGAFVPGERVAVVEDIVTSGGAALTAVDGLRRQAWWWRISTASWTARRADARRRRRGASRCGLSSRRASSASLRPASDGGADRGIEQNPCVEVERLVRLMGIATLGR